MSYEHELDAVREIFAMGLPRKIRRVSVGAVTIDLEPAQPWDFSERGAQGATPGSATIFEDQSAPEAVSEEAVLYWSAG